MRRASTTLRRRAAATLACCALGGASALAQEPWFVVPVEVEGPLERATFEALGTATVIELGLAEGERRTLRVPFGGGSLASLDPVAAAAALRRTDDAPAGDARLAVEAAEGPGPAPRGVSRRGRPPVAPARPTPDPARWMVLAGTAVALLGLRRRPALAAGVGVVSAGLLFLLPAASTASGELLGLDGDLARGRWVEVRSGYAALRVAPGVPGWFELSGGAAPTWRATGGAWELAAEGEAVHLLRPRGAGPLEVSGGRPTEALASLWLRTPDGRWTAHGAWSPGEPFPPVALEAAPGPPGWSAAGLPQGVAVLVGEGAPGSGFDWLRATGSPPIESPERR